MFESLYIHVPFCTAKCDYCAFYSEPGSNETGRRPYIEKLCAELRENSQKCGVLSSIFVGGGTPSILSKREWECIFREISCDFQLAEDYEWTCEANPESLTPELIECWAENGVNRISMGVQAFQQELRSIIGRRGTLDALPKLIDYIDRNGISRLNLDLIFNIPGQSLAQWRDSLHNAVDFGAEHISAYALTIEEGTPLAARTSQPDDEHFLEFWDATDEVLDNAGIRRYEISNFAKPSCECRHNLDIWRGATYLGCGPAAASFDGTDRWANVSSISHWLADTPPERDEISPDKRAAEMLAVGMRTVDGWTWDAFQKRTGVDARSLRKSQLETLSRQGLVILDEEGVKPTHQGMLFNDEIAMELL